MEFNKMKNIVVLKNLPSNIVEEAIVVLKENKSIKVHKYNDKGNNKGVEGYIVKEAEMVISDYISNIEDARRNGLKSGGKWERKYKTLKLFTFALLSLIILSFIIV